MRSSQSACLGAIGGAIVATAILWQHGTPVDAPPPASPASTPVQSPASGPTAASLDLRPITTRLDQIVDRLRALEERVGSATAASPDRQAVATAPTKVAIDADSLQQAMAEIEHRKLESMTDEELRRTAWQAFKSDGASDTAERALELLVQRTTDPAKRDEARTDLAMMQRMRGGDERLATAARTLQSVIDANGFDTSLGVKAAGQLVYTLDSQNNPAAALRQAEAIVRSAAASDWDHLEFRMTAASLRQKLGDPAQARADYEALLRDIDGKPDYVKLEKQVRSRLEK